MKGVRVLGGNSSDGDLHFVWEESTALYASRSKQRLTEAEAKKITKVEAAKLLRITRQE
jgi:hypothetical protein